ncbi:TPA: hypothetical protein I7730_00865 [Vibrio vulnificus]|uniref:Uncharacterized protein n=1 Tax=Vibrio vulnificus TaxID=672 RepID=A0A8H9MY59_VIBVL|nr:hypothetical protein [Vibrio vulnificus]HAS8538351.1 hypothetical protein [Vibrio vulnificus]
MNTSLEKVHFDGGQFMSAVTQLVLQDELKQISKDPYSRLFPLIRRTKGVASAGGRPRMSFGLKSQGRFDFVGRLMGRGLGWLEISRLVGWSPDALRYSYLRQVHPEHPVFGKGSDFLIPPAFGIADGERGIKFCGKTGALVFDSRKKGDYEELWLECVGDVNLSEIDMIPVDIGQYTSMTELEFLALVEGDVVARYGNLVDALVGNELMEFDYIALDVQGFEGDEYFTFSNSALKILGELCFPKFKLM